MAALTEISFRVYFRGILRPSLPDRCDRSQFLVIDPDKLLCLFQDLPGLCDHKTDGVSHAPGHASLLDHHIPVLLEMPYFIVRHILCSEHGEYARKLQGFFKMDIQHFRPRIL